MNFIARARPEKRQGGGGYGQLKNMNKEDKKTKIYRHVTNDKEKEKKLKFTRH